MYLSAAHDRAKCCQDYSNYRKIVLQVLKYRVKNSTYPQPTKNKIRKNSTKSTMTPRNRKRQSENINKDDQTTTPDGLKENNGTKKKIRTSRGVLAGMTLAVSTLKSEEHGTNRNDSSEANSRGRNGNSSLSSYHEVCDFCQELGATVMGQVCKRTEMLVSTETAASNATQRIRKAIKKGKPIVSVEWLKECRSQKKRVDIEVFRLESIVQASMQKRAENRNDDKDDDAEQEDSLIQAEETKIKKKEKKKKDKKKKKHREEKNLSSSSKAEDGLYAARTIDLGCCCVCHELGTDKDCEWCVECPVRLQQNKDPSG